MADETAGSSTTKTVNNYGNGTSAFENSCGLIFQKEAAACVEAIGPQVQTTSGDISVVYQGDVILGRLAMGVDALNPAAAVELVAGVATAAMLLANQQLLETLLSNLHIIRRLRLSLFFLMASTTIDIDTELSAVNNILGAIGQSPITTLNFDNPEISFIFNLLRDANVDTQAEGWHFNTEKHVRFAIDANGK